MCNSYLYFAIALSYTQDLYTGFNMFNEYIIIPNPISYMPLLATRFAASGT